jgi:phospholipase C
MRNFTRRELLKLGVFRAAELRGRRQRRYGRAASPNAVSCSNLAVIDHVVILIQENRSFDHYISHDWVPQHQSCAMDGFVTSRLPINANDAVLAMSYYNRADLPYYYALADAFTICDNFFRSAMGPTDPNRLYTNVLRSFRSCLTRCRRHKRFLLRRPEAPRAPAVCAKYAHARPRVP